MIRNLFFATAVVAVTCLAAAPVSAQFSDSNPNGDLFAQYVTPNGPNMTTAGMYPAPHYVPPMGAQSYYTYQPLMPHEMMYQHQRNYFNYYSTNGSSGAPDAVTKTSVRWFSGVNHIGSLKHSGRLSDLGYRIHARKYGLGSAGSCDGNCTGGCDQCNQ
jgi:hypothetical protein